MEGQECGAVGLRLLLERIENPRQPGTPARRVQVASRIIERRSTGPCKGGVHPDDRMVLGQEPRIVPV
jgi:LacI family transcriptional regulator